jgi:RimJ/RimL family protein N-acetyltransferase
MQYVAVGSLHPDAAAPLDNVATRRLSVERLDRDDLDELAVVFADIDVWRFEYGRGLTRIETEAFITRQLQLWDDHGFGGCAVREIERAVLVGVVGLAVPTVVHEQLPSVTVGWRFAPAVWGKGYATEAATAVLDQAFTTMALERVGCVTSADNPRSVALAERLGMTLIATAPVTRANGEGTVSVSMFHLVRNDWLSRAR